MKPNIEYIINNKKEYKEFDTAEELLNFRNSLPKEAEIGDLSSGEIKFDEVTKDGKKVWLELLKDYLLPEEDK